MGSADHLRRRRVHDQVSARLAGLSDDELAELLSPESIAWRTHALGGQSGVVEVDGVTVFVKRIALTDLERAAGPQGSTANLFDLPVFYQYGVGSAGFGAGRELRACLRASDWALSGKCPYFPLVYHWRMTPNTRRPPLTDEQQAWVDQAPAHWDGSQAVRARMDAIAAASAAVVLFLEYVPQTLQAWVEAQPAETAPDAALEAAILRMDSQLHEAAAFMNARGMLHFDLHSHNVLTDGEQPYIADFGLAICADFDLSPAERAFFETHRLYDRAYIDWGFCLWLKARVLTPALSAQIDRLAPVAALMSAFVMTVRDESKSTPYPAEALAAAITD